MSLPRLRFDFEPLERPLWWVALFTLLLNDYVLKGSGLVPAWATGKLSDFAFVIVAPVLAAVLLPVGLPARRTLACGAVIGVFVAADVSQRASDAIVRAATLVGLRWRLWPDVTDLLALVCLPLTIHLLRARRTKSAPEWRWRRGVALTLGALACVATSAPPRANHAPYVVNRMERPIDLSVTWLFRTVSCDADVTATAASLAAGDLGSPHVIGLTPGQVTALDSPPMNDSLGLGVVSIARSSRPQGALALCCHWVIQRCSPPASKVGKLMTTAGFSHVRGQSPLTRRAHPRSARTLIWAPRVCGCTTMGKEPSFRLGRRCG